MKVRVFISYLRGFLFGILLAGSTLAWSQVDWPKRPVRVIVPFPPGAGYDIMARAVGERLSKLWGQPVVVENKAGANEILATDHVAKSKGDGYTLLFGSATGLATNHILYPNLPYNPRTQFLPVTRVAQGPIVYVVRSESRFRTLGNLVDAAKAAPDKVSYGSTGAGGSIHIEVSWLASLAKVQFLQVPYQGLAPAIKDVLGGNVDFTAVPLAAVSELIKASRIRAVAVSSTTRLKALPEVPTTTELGFPGTEYNFLMGLAAPAETPRDVAEKIAADVGKVLAAPDFVATQFDPYGYVPVGDSPREFSAYLDAFYTAQQKRVRAANIKLE